MYIMRIESLLLLVGFLRLLNSETCAENTCYGRGTCYQSIDQIVCVCQSEYTGERCQHEKVDCSGRTDNSGCVKGVCINDYCLCNAGYAGSLCEYTDHCRENPCRDHGKCLSLKDGFQCLCDKGYTSSNCEDDIDECSQNPDICQNGGVCQNTDGSFQCQCPSGYNGQLCGYDIDECDPNPCLNEGRCIDDVSDFRCECPSTFSGKRCEVEASDCGCVHGTCSDDPNTSCICDLGWMGYKCTDKITSCDYNPCQNGTHETQISTCKQYFMNRDEPRIHCICGTGLTGDYCETAYNLCDKNPCRGQGDCSPGPGGTYTCACYDGFTADNCETDINECTRDAPCQNNGMCTNTIGSYYCECRTGYGGMNCGIDIDDCVSEPCLNKGHCIDGEDSYTCTCRPGFTGSNCEDEINECDHNNCPSYSVCVDKINHFKCICNAGAEGREGCERDENECTANLCKNGGSCVDLPGDFECSCQTGYSGKTCQFDNTACGVKPCGVYGTCYILNHDISSYYCVCDEGYTGGNCSIDIDECQSNPCQNDAQCIDQPNNFFCDCPQEYTGETCALDAQHCTNNPCENGGTCDLYNVFPYYTCQCQPGYTGSRCRDERLCLENQCENEGKCILLDEASWRCDCGVGYAGITCGTRLAVCGGLACHNGAACIAPNKCQCGPGWTGVECRDKVSSCEDRPCRNGGTCIDSFIGLQFECECKPGYEGKYCETVDSSPCASDPCLNGGRCSPTEYSYRCTCRAGYSGHTCATMDLCENVACKPGYVCENFPPEAPTRYMCCEKDRAICYRSDADQCPLDCEGKREDAVCQEECYNSECKADVVDCSQSLGSSADPWQECPSQDCKDKFNDGVCDWMCRTAQCNYDGVDCLDKPEQTCQYDEYCKRYYNNGLCDQGCNNSLCLWDGVDCLAKSNQPLDDGIRMTVAVSCERVLQFKSQLTYTLDTWSGAVSKLETAVPNETDNRCDLVIRFDERYCLSDCRTSDRESLKNYLWANLQSNVSQDGPAFPFRVIDITDAGSESGKITNPEQVSTAIIATIAVIGLLLVVAAVMVGRNVIRARARLWEPDGFKTTRKRNIKDISTMGDPVHLKTMPKLADQHNFNYYLPEQTHLMEVDLEPMYIMGQTHGRVHEDDETAPMITQAAYEFRQREETASPTTQAEEQIAIGRPAVRMGLGRGETQLHAICRNKKVEELRRILSQGQVDVNVTDTMDRTPLYSAVGSDAVEIVDILLEVDGIDVEKPIKQKGSTPLILATKMVYNSIVEKLLKAGALVNAVDSSGRTALHWAAAVANMHAMELLLQYRANKDSESHKKETPLFLAAREGKLEAVKMLVCHHAQRHLADSMDQRPIDVARDHLHHDIEEVLLTWNMDGSTVIKQQHIQHPGSLTPPQSDDAATGSPNSMPTLSPCTKDPPEKEEKKSSKRKKKKTEHTPQSHQPMYQTGYWAKNQLHSPPNWMSTQMLSPESLQGSPTSTNLPTNIESGKAASTETQQRLSHYPIHGYPLDGSYIPHDQLLSHRPSNRQFPPHNQLEYHSSPDSPEEWPITSPPNSDWSHPSP